MSDVWADGSLVLIGGLVRMAHPTDIYIGKKLRTRREGERVTQLELAEELGLSFQQIQKYESGANRVSASRMWEISKFLGAEPDFFFVGLESGDSPGKQAEGFGNGADTIDKLQHELNTYFQRIDNQALRRRFIHLVRSIAETLGEGSQGKSPQKNRRK